MLGTILSNILGSRQQQPPAVSPADEYSEVDEARAADIQFPCSLMEDGNEVPTKMLIDLYTGVIVDLNAIPSERKNIPCSSISSIAEQDCETLILVISQIVDASTSAESHRIYRFASKTDACSFKQYVNSLNESGRCIRAMFNSIATRNVGVSSCSMITASSLKRGLIKEGLPSCDEDVFKMLSMEGGNGRNASFEYLFK